MPSKQQDKPQVNQEKQERQRLSTIIGKKVLHTLGLGEDPPSSAEITARVMARCPAVPAASGVAAIAR